MRLVAIIFTVIWLVSTVIFVILITNIHDFGASYASGARAPLFSGLLTVGSFLLALKTTILQRMKDAFDSPDQEAKYSKYKEPYSDRSHKYYFGLCNMGAA